jgi:hypothetical protein
MLFFIGGAARAGKSILVRRLLAEQQLPYLSLDVLKMGLARGAPEYGIDPNAGGLPVAERLWPLVREMSRSLLFDRVHYVFEGELLPSHVAALRDAYPSQVYGCFLGYAQIAPAQKLRDIRRYTDHPNDWPQEYTDTALLPIIAREIAFSQYVCRECAVYGWPYFDTSHQFALAHDQAAAYVRSAMQSPAAPGGSRATPPTMEQSA